MSVVMNFDIRRGKLNSVRFSFLTLITLWLSVISLFATADDATQPMVKPDFSSTPGHAVVYVYRDRMLKGSAMPYVGYLNDEKIGLIENGEYMRYVAAPSGYDLWISNVPERAKGARFSATLKEVDFEPGGIYFYKIVPIFGFYWTLEIHAVDADTARKEILTLYDEGK
jgi:hypothetical protein